MDWFKTVCVCSISLLALSFRSSESPIGHQRAPVIIMPGNGGNQLEGRVRNTNSSDPCLQETGWHRLWLDVWSFAPGKLKCASIKRSLVYNNETGTSENQPGLETRVPGWGGTNSVDYLDTSWAAFMLANIGSYMAPLTTELKRWGYTVGVDLLAAPYDWRLLPQSQKLFSRFQDLIESTSARNGGRKVALIGHSLGCRYILMFLQNQSTDWKNKYIHSFSAIGAPWGGATLSPVAVVSGYNLRIPIVSGIDIRQEQRSSESNMFLLPSSYAFPEDKPVISTPDKKYTINDYNELFDDIDYPEGKRRLADMDSIRNNMSHPGVELHCLYSHGLQTEDTFVYSDGAFPDGQPDISWTDGDAIVTLDSLKACEKWGNSQTTIKSFHGIHHNSLLGDASLLRYLKGNLIG